jgi:hypothetical protein
LRPKVFQVLSEHANVLVGPAQFVRTDDPEGSNAAKRSDFGSPE